LFVGFSATESKHYKQRSATNDAKVCVEYSDLGMCCH